MSDTKYESKIVSSTSSAAQIYNVLSNLKNIERVKDLIPKDKIQEMEISEDQIRIKVDGLGQKLTIAIIERVENDMIKFGLEGIPMQANLWIQLKEIADSDTRIKLTIKADIPMMFKIMIGNKLQQGLDQAADMLAQFPYAAWQ
jgi:carbon monoxide dehydrogenase subunit G